MCRLCENLELKSLFRSFGQEIIRDRLAGEEQNPTGGTLFRQKNRKVDAVCLWKNNVDDRQIR
jgi:hypothetical protein